MGAPALREKSSSLMPSSLWYDPSATTCRQESHSHQCQVVEIVSLQHLPLGFLWLICLLLTCVHATSLIFIRLLTANVMRGEEFFTPCWAWGSCCIEGSTPRGGSDAPLDGPQTRHESEWRPHLVEPVVAPLPGGALEAKVNVGGAAAAAVCLPAASPLPPHVLQTRQRAEASAACADAPSTV